MEEMTGTLNADGARRVYGSDAPDHVGEAVTLSGLWETTGVARRVCRRDTGEFISGFVSLVGVTPDPEYADAHAKAVALLGSE